MWTLTLLLSSVPELLLPRQASWNKASKTLVEDVKVYKAENGDRYRTDRAKRRCCALWKSVHVSKGSRQPLP